ncbi:MAG: hypothetical protein DRN83_01005 [Hadesarchaea archaeon]|nr:MAG: hypothetical protein DRN83_01005 [Hadesarchaea archaeon]HDI12561.1 hypothetical protein [Hadesarchaea archaeon]
MLETLTMTPEIVTNISEALKNASPVVLIVLGALLFFFAGAVKWLVKVAGVGMVIYGLLIILGYI